MVKKNSKMYIDVVATASQGFDVDNQAIYNFAKKLGLKIRLPKYFQQKDEHHFHANSNLKRFDDLHNAIIANDSNYIWCFRGGYGSAKLIDLLEEHDYSANQKIIVGFSDVTSLMLYFNKKYGWPAVHAMMVYNFLKSDISDNERENFLKIISGDYTEIAYSLKPYNKFACEIVSLQGQIIGGNLTLLTHSIGTNWQLDSKNKILFIEDVNEAPYRIERMILHLKQANILGSIKALILGDMGLNSEADKIILHKAITEIFTGFKIPILQSNNFGHGKVNLPLIFGKDALIKKSADCELILSY